MSEWKGVTNASCENLKTCICKCCNIGALYIDTFFDVTKFTSLDTIIINSFIQIHILNYLNMSSVLISAFKFPNIVEYSCGRCKFEKPSTLGPYRSYVWCKHFYC